jgi:hypothetical protein
VAELKAPGKTGGWADCRIGPLAFKLPHALAVDADRSVEQETVVFAGPEKQFRTNIPHRIDAPSRDGNTRLFAEFKMSPTRMIAESYRTGTDDFRWLMSHAELRRYEILLNLGAGDFSHGHAMTVETRFDGAVEGVLIRGDRQTAVFRWQTTSGAAFGVMVFHQKDGDLDLDWVRDVCQSLACDESRLVEKAYTKRELRELLEVIEVKPTGD